MQVFSATGSWPELKHQRNIKVPSASKGRKPAYQETARHTHGNTENKPGVLLELDYECEFVQK